MAKTDKRSRYVHTSTAQSADEGSDAFTYYELRRIPRVPPQLRLTATAADRLDLLAQRFYRDPTQFWKICDAADHLDPFDVVAVNEPVWVPPDKRDPAVKKGGKK